MKLAPVLEKNPIFRQFLSASTISLLGSNIFDISMPLYVFGRTHSPLALSAVTVALQLPYFLMAPITGYAVDFYDNRKLMLLSDLAQMALLTVLLIFESSSSTALWPILLTAFLVKSFAILFETVATFHLVPNLVRGRDLSEANTWLLSSQRLIQIVGPLLGGLLFGVIGFRASIVANILSFTATLYFVYRMRDLSKVLHAHRSGAHPHPPLKQIWASFTSSFRHVWMTPLFRGLIFTMFFWNLSSLTPNTATITYFFSGELGYSPLDYGAVISIFAFFSMCGFFISPQVYRKLGFKGAFYASAFWQAVLGTIAVCFFKSPMLFILFFSLSRMGGSVMSMGTFLIRQTEVPKGQSGSINSTLRMHFMSATSISGAVQGSLLHQFGVFTSLLFGAVCLWAVTWWGRMTSEAYKESARETDLAA